MTIYAILDDQQRVTMWSTSQFADAQAYEIDDYDRFYQCSFCYYLQDDKLVYDDKMKEKAERTEQITEQIAQLKEQLLRTDYQAIKFAEGWLSADEYTETLNQRQQWRDQINALEKELETTN